MFQWVKRIQFQQLINAFSGNKRVEVKNKIDFFLLVKAKNGRLQIKPRIKLGNNLRSKHSPLNNLIVVFHNFAHEVY